MKKKLLTAVSAAAALSLALSIAAVIICSNAFSSASRGDAAASLQPEAPGTEKAPAATDTATDPAESAGSYSDDAYLLICSNGILRALDGKGTELLSTKIDIELLSDSERERLEHGIIIAGRSALRDAIDDLTR